jgi:hypothetical protein
MAAVVVCRDGLSVVALCDAVGTAPEPLEAMFPALGRTGTWRLHVHCFPVRAGSRLVLVDTGIGPAPAPGRGGCRRRARCPTSSPRSASHPAR